VTARSRPGGVNRERSFGLSVGGVLIVIAALLAWRGRVTRAEIVGVIGVVLVVGGAFAPKLLKWPSDLWWAFAMALGWVNARVLLSVLFFLILSPLGLLWRLTGRDPLSLRRSSYPGWTPYPERLRRREHFERMF
jgi:saxitoxin biosynthesis operon SxtJ-like protein